MDNRLRQYWDYDRAELMWRLERYNSEGKIIDAHFGDKNWMIRTKEYFKITDIQEAGFIYAPR